MCVCVLKSVMYSYIISTLSFERFSSFVLQSFLLPKSRVSYVRPACSRLSFPRTQIIRRRSTEVDDVDGGEKAGFTYDRYLAKTSAIVFFAVGSTLLFSFFLACLCGKRICSKARKETNRSLAQNQEDGV